ncbi:MAG: DUF1338 family protein [Mariniphaga sp.]|jgi:hypothetical protein|nr:DUF1338 family protein [Mariniphaga sp.]
MKRNASEIGKSLIDKLWEAYILRVPYAKTYAGLVNSKGGQVVLDHVGFRTLNWHTGEQPEGILAIRHIIECFGYHPAGKYVLPKKNLKAVHFEAESEDLPKFYVSQLEVSNLPGWAQNLFPDVLSDTPYLLSDIGIELLSKLKADGILNTEASEILTNELVNYFRRPWDPPAKETVLKLNDISHYAAWVLLHGNSPSHFASSINKQGVDAWPDLESTYQAMKEAGIPVKDKIEGEKGSVLQQTATLAVKEDLKVKTENEIEEISWPYAYLEFIERGYIEQEGHQTLFQGFIENQERHLYNLTRTLDY